MRRLIAAAFLALALPGTVPAVRPDLSDFTRLDDISDVSLSPSGNELMIVRQAKDERYQIEIRDVADLAKGGMSFDAMPAEIRSGRWLSDTLLLVGLRERRKRGVSSEWFNFNAIFDNKGRLAHRLPNPDAEILALGAGDPTILYLAYDDTGDGSPDVIRFNAKSGRAERLLRGSLRRFNFIIDRIGEARVSTTFDPVAFEVTTWARMPNEDRWFPISKSSPRQRDTFQPLGFFDDDPALLTVLANNGNDKSGIYVFDLTKKIITRTIYLRNDVDVDNVINDRDWHRRGVLYRIDRPRVEWLDAASKAAAEMAETLVPGSTAMPKEASANGSRIVRIIANDRPDRFYLLKPGGRMQALGSIAPQFDGKQMAEPELVTLRARDGRSIPTFVTKPLAATRSAPLIVMPHGGPWSRDSGGFDEWAQLFASQGYVVAQPQFRGSMGFGKAHWLAGDRQWGYTMQDDLDDTAKALVASGVADPAHIAMVGWSYGGYAAEVASFRKGGPYRCSIAGAGVSDLNRIGALLAESAYARLYQKPTIAGLSPIQHFGKTTIPLLLIHGDEDHVVDVSHSRAAAAELKATGHKDKYVEMKGLDHTLDKFSSRQREQVYSSMLSFLRSCL